MKKLITFLSISGFVCLIGFSSSCTKEYLQTSPPLNPTDTIYYAADIQPFFDNSCTNTSCHKPGGIFASLDLTVGASYNSLHTGGYINTADAANSLLYTKINTGGSMSQYSTSDDRAMTLSWIEQGALNN